MASFWQLSGPESHLRRDWRDRKHGNATIAEDVFNALSVKYESGRYGLEVILGMAGYISHLTERYLNWGSNNAYRSSRFASLSPIHIETPLKLHTLLEQRQNASKATKASKQKGDTSKANGRFWNGPPNPSRAAFEHSRCLWRIIQNDFQPQTYGLPEAPWCRHAVIFSLALNFWAPDGVQFTTRLIDASLTKFVTQDNVELTGLGTTWYFVAEENQGLQNSFEAEGVVVQGTWNTKVLHQDEIGSRIQALLDAHSQPKDNLPTPILLLVHDYPKVKGHLVTLGGLKNNQWAVGVADLLGFRSYDRHFKQEEYSPSRTRPCSPHDPRSSSTISSKREDSRGPQQLHASVYVVDTVEMFKTVTEWGVDPYQIRPVTIFNAIAGRNELDTWCAGDDSRYTLQSWKGMVQGPSIDELKGFFGEYAGPTTSLAQDESDKQVADAEALEAENLHEVQQKVHVDKFNDGSGSESEGEW